MSGIILLLGSNLGDSHQVLADSRQLIEKKTGSISQASPIYWSEAWGYKDQPPFLNQAIRVNSSLQPANLLENILEIEKELGRIRVGKWRERLIDIDILYYEQLIINTSRLTIPHPEIQNRKFALVPLVDIVPDFEHPVLKLTQKQMLENLQDPLAVSLYQPTL